MEYEKKEMSGHRKGSISMLKTEYEPNIEKAIMEINTEASKRHKGTAMNEDEPKMRVKMQMKK